MPGQLAHICLVNSVCTPEGLKLVPALLPSIRSALENYLPFCRLGSVSPDCPVVVGSTDASGWNKVMHYVRPADFVRSGILKVLEMSFTKAETRACIAWLFGYAAHLVADCTVHPVLTVRVGPYANKKNRPAHRRCELDQDSHIFFKLTGREIVETDFLRFTGLADCGVKGRTHKLNPAIRELWAHCLRQYPRAETKQYVRLPNVSLNPDSWFATYANVMDQFATKDSAFVRWLGFGYHRSNQVDPSYVQKLPTPDSSEIISYDGLFELARQNLVQTWGQLARSLAEENVGLFTLPNANLDTGKDNTGKLVYWS